MEIIDLNGTGEWSRARLQKRYAAYRTSLGLEPSELIVRESAEENRKWFYPMLDDVIQRIKDGDAASVAIGIDLIEEDQGFPFGRRLKSEAANALRHAKLQPSRKLGSADELFPCSSRVRFHASFGNTQNCCDILVQRSCGLNCIPACRVKIPTLFTITKRSSQMTRRMTPDFH